ncbi:MAG TPA: nucleotide exchange factor GrpE [Planctomycetota bacterium]|jgi:molecular chaperone GrpE
MTKVDKKEQTPTADAQESEQAHAEPSIEEGTPVEAPKAEPAAAKKEPSKVEAARKEDLASEAEDFCTDLERFFRRAFGEMPKATELGELRAQQATARSLVRRASAIGGESNEKVAELTAERDKLKDTAARARADFLNYQSRASKDLARAEEQSLRKYVADLLPIFDSLDLARRDAQGEKADIKLLREALEMVGQSLDQTLAVRGLERINAVPGTPFDPTQHEAVAQRPVDESKGEKPGTVLEELRAGYLWKGLVLRPAQVLTAAAAKA